MKEIILGIKDYCKDCWHDWLYSHLEDIDPDAQAWWWKEGNLKYYIKQRQLANKKGK